MVLKLKKKKGLQKGILGFSKKNRKGKKANFIWYETDKKIITKKRNDFF